jgi:hypothetical protein
MSYKILIFLIAYIPLLICQETETFKKVLNRFFDVDFMLSNKNFTNCLYLKQNVPYIGLEVNLSKLSSNIKLPSLLQTKIAEFLTKPNVPQCLTEEEAMELSIIVLTDNYKELSTHYKELKKCDSCYQNFDDLPIAIKTVLLSYFYDKGSLSQEILDELSQNNWDKLIDRYPQDSEMRIKEKEFLSNFISCKNRELIITFPNGLLEKKEFSDYINESNVMQRENWSIEDKFPYNFYYTNTSSPLKTNSIRRHVLKAISDFKKLYEIKPNLVVYEEIYVNKSYNITITSLGSTNSTLSNINQTELAHLSTLKGEIKHCNNKFKVLDLNDRNGQIMHFNIIEDIADLAVWAIILLIIIPIFFFTMCCFTVCKFCFGPTHHFHHSEPILIDRGNNFNL